MRPRTIVLLSTVGVVASAILILLSGLGASAAGGTPTPVIPGAVAPPKVPGTTVPTPNVNAPANGPGRIAPAIPSVLPAKRTDVPGAPAIRPASTSDILTPSFTSQDAMTYVTAHPILEAQGKPVAIGRVQFLTAEQIKAQLRLDTGLDANRLLCIVQMNGLFAIPTYAGGPQQTSAVFYQVFDAHTGNLLIEATGQQQGP